MFTSDIALKMDPAYGKVSKRFFENPKEFEKAFGKDKFGKSRRADKGEEGRFRAFTRDEIKARGGTPFQGHGERFEFLQAGHFG